MPSFLIEVPHKDEKVACARAIQTFLNSGSHFLTNAEWGCFDGDHKAWIMLEMDSKEEARSILPPAYRSQAKIVRLKRFKMEEIDEVLRQHESQE